MARWRQYQILERVSEAAIEQDFEEREIDEVRMKAVDLLADGNLDQSDFDSKIERIDEEKSNSQVDSPNCQLATSTCEGF